MCTVSDLDPVVLGHALAVLAETDPGHPLLYAARVAVEIADARRSRRAALKAWSVELAGAYDWRRIADRRVPFDELRRRRAEGAA